MEAGRALVVPDEPGSGPDTTVVLDGDADQLGISESRTFFVAVRGDRSNSEHALVDGRTIALLNIIGLLGFAAAVRAYLPAREREPWIWGLALQAVSPFAIRLSRKIWPPSILTPLLLLLWISHQYRQTRWGAFAWGLAGALIGQVHLSGWFVAVGLLAATMIAEWRGTLPRSRFWHWWLLGTILGLTIAFPWACALPRSTFSAPTVIMIKDRSLAYCYGIVAGASSALPYQVLGLGEDEQAYQIGPMIGGIWTHVTEFLGMFVLLAFAARIVFWLIDIIVAPGLRWSWRMITNRISRSRTGNAAASTEATDGKRRYESTGFYLWSTIAIPGVSLS